VKHRLDRITFICNCIAKALQAKKIDKVDSMKKVLPNSAFISNLRTHFLLYD
jgi:hypothetical protein